MKIIIKLLLTLQGIFFFFSSHMFIISPEDTGDKWFYRLALSIICFGFLYIGEVLEDKKENKQ